MFSSKLNSLAYIQGCKVAQYPDYNSPYDGENESSSEEGLGYDKRAYS